MDEACLDFVVNVEALDEVRMLAGGSNCVCAANHEQGRKCVHFGPALSNWTSWDSANPSKDGDRQLGATEREATARHDQNGYCC